MPKSQFLFQYLRPFFWVSIFVITCLQATAQINYITKDSVIAGSMQQWKHSKNDSAHFALPTYTDTHWKSLWLTLDPINLVKHQGSRVQWHRMSFVADSSLANFPVILQINHVYAASEIYLDGKLIKQYGTIGEKDIVAGNPNSDFLMLPLITPGNHVLAIRYASLSMFTAMLSCKIQEPTEGFIELKGALKIIVLATTTVAIYLVFALLHLFLFIAYRKSTTNLLFSVYSFTYALSTALLYVNLSNEYNPSIQKICYVLTTINGIALIHFVYLATLQKSKRTLKITYVSGATVIVLDYLINSPVFTFNYLLVGLSIIYSVISVIRATYNKVQGAWIFALGIIVSAISFIGIAIHASVFGFTNSEKLYQFGTSQFSSFWDLAANYSDFSLGVFYTLNLLCFVSIPLSASIHHSWTYSNLNRNLRTQENQVKELTTETIVIKHEKDEIQRQKTEEERLRKIAEEQRQLVEKQRDEIDVARRRSDELLENILPSEIAVELKQKGNVDPVLLQEVTVLFADFVGFTKASSTRSPSEIVSVINTYFTAFDAITQLHGVEKIKTIGDAYMLASGVPSGNPIHAKKVIEVAMEMLKAVHDIKLSAQDESAPVFDLRIGINSGPVIAGIVGVKKFQYDIWGDTVNTASRMETASEPGRINISESTYELVKEFFDCEYRGEIEVKGKGKVKMYFVTGTKA